MALDLKLKLDLDEQGVLAKYLRKNRRTKFSVGLLCKDKDFKFNDGIMKIEQEGVGEFDLEVKDGNIKRFLLMLQYPGKENITMKLGGTVRTVGIKRKTIDPRLEIRVGEIVFEGEVEGGSLQENMRKFDGKFAIGKGNKKVEIQIEDGKIIGLGGSLEFGF